MSEIVVDYPWATPPEAPRTQEVAPGIHWLRLPLPIALNHVNVYLLEDDDGLVIFDTGFNTLQLQSIWQEVLRHFKLGSCPRIICSHYHPDHFGLVGHLHREYGFSLHMAQTEWLIAKLLGNLSEEQSLAMQQNFYRLHGMHEEALQRHQNRGRQFRDATTGAPPHYQCIQHGQTIKIGQRNWEVISAAGHTPEQLCLYSSADKVLLSADHILPRITPNTSLFAYNPGTNPLADYLASFERFQHIDPDTLALPCHDLPFRGVHRRIKQLSEHHEQRLDELLALCEQAQHTYGLISPMFTRTLDPHQEMFALGEILAHLKLLVSRGKLREFSENNTQYFVTI